MFLDIGAGILASIFISFGFQMELSFYVLAAGIVGALSPDVDYIVHLLQGGSSKDDKRHRELIHYPLIFLPVVFLIFYPLGIHIAGAFTLGAFFHFVHDSIGLGWGIQWLYPFKKDHYTFLYLYQGTTKERVPRKLIYVWKNEEIDTLDERYGDTDWLQNIYYKFHPFALVEYGVFIGAVLLLFWYAR